MSIMFAYKGRVGADHVIMDTEGWTPSDGQKYDGHTQYPGHRY